MSILFLHSMPTPKGILYFIPAGDRKIWVPKQFITYDEFWRKFYTEFPLLNTTLEMVKDDYIIKPCKGTHIYLITTHSQTIQYPTIISPAIRIIKFSKRDGAKYKNYTIVVSEKEFVKYRQGEETEIHIMDKCGEELIESDLPDEIVDYLTGGEV